MEKYKTGTGQKILVHDKEVCEGEFCCIHNPSDHHMINWPTHWRDDRLLMERICPHGIGHPDPDDLAWKKRHNFPDARGIHGCDGCCNETIKTSESAVVRKVKKIDDFQDPDLDHLGKK